MELDETRDFDVVLLLNIMPFLAFFIYADIRPSDIASRVPGQDTRRFENAKTKIHVVCDETLGALDPGRNPPQGFETTLDRSEMC